MSLLVYDPSAKRYRPARKQEVCEAAAQYLLQPLYRGDCIASPRALREYVATAISQADREHFMVIFLDNRHRVIVAEVLFHGTIDGASVHPREVVKRALDVGAAAVIFAHNHPSGNPEPSNADETITGRLKDALALVDIRVLDHILTAPGMGVTVSFAERGLI